MPKYCRDTFITTKILLYYWIDLSNWAVSYATGKSVRHNLTVSFCCYDFEKWNRKLQKVEKMVIILYKKLSSVFWSLKAVGIEIFTTHFENIQTNNYILNWILIPKTIKKNITVSNGPGKKWRHSNWN